jgi:hypothetical protein
MTLEQFIPPSNTPDSSGKINVSSGTESRENAPKYVQRAVAMRAPISTVISSRATLEQYLLQSGLILLTSALELDATGDFIAASYIKWPNGILESAKSFCDRHPDVIPSFQAVRQSLTNTKGHIGLSVI